ncbi:MAG TPA: hypothetical protein VFX78_03745 [Candidatus Eisenbacteria bacterium]|jgi:hypothetical protein|nr:hypothetical protein [Candidatus Eisenbacteria bacterium]
MRKGRYVQLVSYRVAVVVLAILTGALAMHERGTGASVWLLSAILGVAAASALVWPLVVPARDRTMSVYSIGPAFFLAGMFLLPPPALVGIITFAVLLSGLIRGDRAYRTAFRLGSMVLVFAGFAVWFRLSPQGSEILYKPAARATLEMAIGGAALVALLILKSLEIRLEHGPEQTPHWGAFQKPAIMESMLCLAFSTSTVVLARIHTGFLTVVGFQMVMVWWFLHRYAAYTTGLARVTDRRKRPRAILWDAATRDALRVGPFAAPLPRRFPHDSAAREAREDDDEDWKSERTGRSR